MLNISNIILETINDLIDEEYPESFKMEEFKKLVSFYERIKYCEENLTHLSSGSSRLVYIIDNDKVLKLAKNKKGIAQNNTEINLSGDYMLDGLLAEVYDYEEDGFWLEMEYCKKLTKSEFNKIAGVSFDQFIKIIDTLDYTRSGGRGYINNHINMDEYVDNEFIMSIQDIILNFSQIVVADLKKLSSWGINKKSNIVLIDYGLNDVTWNTHYKKRE